MVGGSEDMHTEIFNNIDLLVSMAGSTLNVQDIESELITINREIQDKKSQLEDLKSMMNDTRYFNASSELVDKNIEVSLQSKIRRLMREIKKIELQLNQAKKEEGKLYSDISSLKERIEENEKYVDALASKTEGSTNEAFKGIVSNEKEHLEHLKEEMSEKEKKHQSVLKDLELQNQALLELNEKREREEDRLKEITDHLGNPNTYMDEDLKRQDEERLRTLNEAIDDLQKKKLEYLTDPNMVGADAKELIANGNYTEALNKIKELLATVKSKPFMDVSNLSVLDEELEKRENERAELSNYIDTKDYAGVNQTFLSNRISSVNEEIILEQEVVQSLESIHGKVDQNMGSNLSEKIASLETDVTRITKEKEEYQTLMADVSKSRKTKVNLENAILKKEKEKEAMNLILDHYKQDLLFQITLSNTISKLIQKLNGRNHDYEEEIQELQHMSVLEEVSIDYIEEEKDKEKLRKINEEIKQIKNRKKFDKTPDELYDQIEMLLANFSATTPSNQAKKEEPVDLDIDELFSDEERVSPRIKVVEMIPAQTVRSDGGSSYGA